MRKNKRNRKLRQEARAEEHLAAQQDAAKEKAAASMIQRNVRRIILVNKCKDSRSEKSAANPLPSAKPTKGTWKELFAGIGEIFKLFGDIISSIFQPIIAAFNQALASVMPEMKKKFADVASSLKPQSSFMPRASSDFGSGKAKQPTGKNENDGREEMMHRLNRRHRGCSLN